MKKKLNMHNYKLGLNFLAIFLLNGVALGKINQPSECANIECSQNDALTDASDCNCTRTAAADSKAVAECKPDECALAPAAPLEAHSSTSDKKRLAKRCCGCCCCRPCCCCCRPCCCCCRQCCCRPCCCCRQCCCCRPCCCCCRPCCCCRQCCCRPCCCCGGGGGGCCCCGGGGGRRRRRAALLKRSVAGESCKCDSSVCSFAPRACGKTIVKSDAFGMIGACETYSTGISSAPFAQKSPSPVPTRFRRQMTGPFGTAGEDEDMGDDGDE